MIDLAVKFPDHSTKQHAYDYILSVLRQGKTSAGTPSEGVGGVAVVVVGGGGKAVCDDDYDYDKDCNADTDNSDDDNGDHEWIIIPP
ncbi:hypothetical protein DPMN_110432 [Dreissena polymorpha]|uniref:Uncharacterized protein n=1 Tax=Dreissena polymorpha TaxID=45954 RepID=A0A9D4KCM9_DREPO|nr:hypothetical protein DPMN_110432 [Dreissena polymorpha]